MLDDNDDIENISGLNLLESLDLGRRKIYKEEAKEKEMKILLIILICFCQN